MKIRAKSSCVIYLIFLCVTGCAHQGNQLTSGFTFDKNSRSGVVIVGFRSVENDGSKMEVLPELRIRNFIKESMQATEKFIAVKVPIGPARLSGGYEAEANRTYYVFSLEPGNYYMESLGSWYFRKITKGNRSITTQGDATTLLNRGTYAFEVKAGSVIYIGEVLYDRVREESPEVITGALSSTLSEGQSHQEKAELIMSSYEGVNPKLRPQKLQSINFECDGVDGIQKIGFKCPSDKIRISWR